METIYGIIGLIAIGVTLFSLYALFFGKVDPKKGRDYQEIVLEDGRIHYMIGGIISPMKPKPYNPLVRYFTKG